LYITNVADKTAIIHICTCSADTNNAIGYGDSDASVSAQGRVAATGSIRIECTITHSRVADTSGIVRQS